MLKIISLVILLQLSFFSNYCGECRTMLGREQYNEVYNIPHENESERVKKLLSYPVEKQIDIYLFAKECADDSRVIELFYSTGQDKISSIANRVASSSNEKDKMNLIWALMWIDHKCNCVKKDSETIKILANAEERINDTDTASIKIYKERYSTTLNLLKNDNDINH